ncbi:MAG: sigma-70 family RNA polymerase sigma factor [Blastocatellia bacterium]|nr:sigma-70 family RNA polymerase sigma factor [Blastocatellia bacterium]
MNAEAPESVTELLLQWRKGDRAAFERLVPLVYGELHRLARRCLRRERASHTMQTTDLVNEAYLKLIDASQVHWHDRAHFFAIAAQLMRQVLVDEARRRRSQKRGSDFTRISLDEALVVSSGQDAELIALDDALEGLARFAPRKCRVVELRFFGGLSIEETAAALGVSTDIVKREWRTAKLWLLNELDCAREAGDGPGAMGPD